ncbi:hypothetical protein H6F43_18995 [Leptolyngbya sp. FACHB-36]|nr:hypothetical protein [Leptolyngbya sp. FACHB-36]
MNIRTALLALLLASPIPALAHNVEVAGDVAVTMHLEPNHNPKSGEPSLAWFALTRQGGRLISLEQCNCKLMVRAVPRTAAAPVVAPALKPIDAEQYRGIPGATIVFPQSGQYTLALSGSPKGGETFKPFDVSYTVTVTAGTAASPSPKSQAVNSSQAPESKPTVPAAPIAALLGSGVAVAITMGLLRRLKK